MAADVAAATRVEALARVAVSADVSDDRWIMIRDAEHVVRRIRACIGEAAALAVLADYSRRVGAEARVSHHGTNVTGRITATGGAATPFGPADSDGPPATSVAKVWPEPGASPGDTPARHAEDDEGGDAINGKRLVTSDELYLPRVFSNESRKGVIDDASNVYDVELAEPLWLVRDAGDVWQLSQPWVTRVNWRTGEIEHCTGFVGVSDVRVLKKGDRVWVRIV